MPELAARSHVEKIDSIVKKAIDDSGVEIKEIDAVASTAGPGLVVCLSVGLSFGKSFASVCICRTSLDSVELLPRGWRAVAFPRSLHVQSCSTWLILIVRCCFGGLCVRDGLAASVCICHTVTLLLLPLSIFLGVDAPSLSLGGFIF